MTAASTPEAMSSRSSHSPALDVDEPRKKGSRGGKRSVSHLSKAQLARKRANDREAQRNIRQRTKEHIENLERKVQELEAGGRSSSMESVLRRNQALENEIEKLRAQVASTQSTPSQSASELCDDLYTQPKQEVNWLPEASWPNAVPPHISPMAPNTDLPNSMAMAPTTYPTDGMQYQPRSSMGYEHEVYAPNNMQVWNDPVLFGPPNPQQMTKAPVAWAGFHPAFNQPSRFGDLQQSGFTELVNNPISTSASTSTFTPTSLHVTSWQNQPFIFCNLSTKLKAPVTHLDQLMFNVIQTQRRLAMTSDLTSEEVVGPKIPSVHVFFNQPGPTKPPSCLTDVMERYSALLSSRGFALIPEKLASFMCMYRFVQWQITPNHETFKNLYEWQAPRDSQLTIEHPAWMDLPPWGAFRDMVIQNQARYDNPEFQNDYASNLSINFPYHPMQAIVYENGNIKVSQLLESHIGNTKNMSMKKAFADKYPEFRSACRFDEF